MKPDASDTKNSTPRAILSASPKRPTGILATIFSNTFRVPRAPCQYYIARRYGVDRDAFVGALLGEGLSKAVNARLGGGVVYLAILTGLAIDGADVNNAAKIVVPHLLNHSMVQVKAGA